ncbi:MAG: Uncharacterized protein AWT59_3211 [Candidatus Gallionella acididurans]|uniref:BrnT family toxin n=1 Tax=Candidatus Gallionella acididurans TaxID=1796491 RepID=A0A139BNT0_9PROT|nr:MAG: Uncharacterized protein AWT59_3211 [Candidatus Gallionella acididurans]
MNISFEWDEDKAQANLKKHHVRFEIAARVFLDPLALAYQDRIENGEYRWQTLGMVDGCLLLLVAHTVRQDEDGEVIRIISARKAGKKEQIHYEKKR